jgi:8-oxo-dGTP pyrophosphatase MutT (NUDIX family)
VEESTFLDFGPGQMTDLRTASTMILLRDADSGPEVFLVKRHIKSDFVGGAHVFPGGVVEPADALDDALCAGRTDDSASKTLGLPRGGLAYWAAAIRECFEEAGVLLACDSQGRIPVFEGEHSERFRSYRRALNSNEMSFAEMLLREGLKLAAHRVYYWGHWVTPEGEPRRYDTRFFLAVAPERQTAAHDGRELTDSAWAPPAVALEKARTREWTIIFPTVRNLMLLKAFRTARDAESHARQLRHIPMILPRVVSDEKGTRILIPGDEGYERASATADAATAENYAGPSENGEKGVQ